MDRSFNTEGPCLPGEHYMLPPLERIPDALELVNAHKYFVLHAPRQSGKTTSLLALRDELNRQGDCYAVYCSLEEAGVDFGRGDVNLAIAGQIREDVLTAVNIQELENIPLNRDRPEVATRLFLNAVCRKLDKPLVLLLDEVDSMQGEGLLSLLCQLRKGYVSRGDTPFPASVALVGMRNIRDYRIQIRPESETLGTASPFNIAAKYLTLGVFTEEQIGELYVQHPADTGQVFDPSAVRRAHYWTSGQPWLVNAIARDCVEELSEGDSTRTITAEMVDKAAHGIILRREVHIDSLLARLHEPAVRRVLEPAIVGDDLPIDDSIDRDLSMVLDMGLLKYDGKKQLVPANRMYAEVFLRVLSQGYQARANTAFPIIPAWAREDGLDMDGLLRGFQAFWRENSEMYTRGELDYPEALPHLVLMGFLQRVVNGGGRIVREWAVGSGRLDLLVEYRQGRYPIELKIKGHGSQGDGVAQLLGYMDGLGVSDGWLLTFDRTAGLPWEGRLTWETIQRDGKTVRLVGA